MRRGVEEVQREDGKVRKENEERRGREKGEEKGAGWMGKDIPFYAEEMKEERELEKSGQKGGVGRWYGNGVILEKARGGEKRRIRKER